MKPILYVPAAFVGYMLMMSPAYAQHHHKGRHHHNKSKMNHEKGIQVHHVKHSKSFPGATLEVRDIETQAAKDDPNSVTLKVTYNVRNFVLTQVTEDPNTHEMANSHQGQHIHFIMDDASYVPLYEPAHETKLKKGTEHYLLSFLSRSYHESIKEKEAFVLNHFKISTDGKYESLPIPNTPMLFYSRPKGEYIGEDTHRILLDFYILNTELSKKGNKVKAEINGNTFVLDRWQPYQITGLPMGKNTIKITLIDAAGHPLKGENTSVERTIMLKTQ